MRYFNFIAAVILTLLYSAGKIPPQEKFNLWFFTFIIPFALASNFILLFISLALRKKSSIYYLVTILIGSNYLVSTIGLKYLFKKEKATPGSFSVISYNAQTLSAQSPAAALDSSYMAFTNWILNNKNDIKCFQEFRNDFGNNNFDIVRKFKEQGYYTYFSYDSIHAYRSTVVGVLIASKFPIIRSGDIISSDNGFNRMTYADLIIQHDTLRIINVHLESMGLKQYHPAYTSGLESKKENAKIIFRKLKEGVFERSYQVKLLSDFVKRSPYPVICAGDFNDLPYSYSYQFMRKRMKNTFEEIGKGFGFTYNGKTLRALRIDNQFYSSRIEPVDFKTLNHINFSDHFPVQGSYLLTSKNSKTQDAPDL